MTAQFPTSPTILPSVASSGSTKFNVLEFQGGDGYTVTVPYGINYKRDSFNITIGPVKLDQSSGVTDYMLLEGFFNSQNAVKGFTWQNLPFNLGYFFNDSTLKEWQLDYKTGISRRFTNTTVEYSFTITQKF